jgi:hypothetical protein
MLEAFGLSWLAGILSSVLSDGLKERLRPATATEKARTRAFTLFESLQAVTRTTDAFVEALASYAWLVESGVPEGAVRLSELPGAEDFDRKGFASRDEASSARLSLLERRGTLPSPADVAVVRAQGSLWETTRDLREALEGLEPALKEVDPQLAIHQPDVSRAISDYIHMRGMVFYELEALAWHAPLELRAGLRRIVSQAKKNQRNIRSAVDKFRAFLAKEFSFKESF